MNGPRADMTVELLIHAIGSADHHLDRAARHVAGSARSASLRSQTRCFSILVRERRAAGVSRKVKRGHVRARPGLSPQDPTAHRKLDGARALAVGGGARARERARARHASGGPQPLLTRRRSAGKSRPARPVREPARVLVRYRTEHDVSSSTDEELATLQRRRARRDRKSSCWPSCFARGRSPSRTSRRGCSFGPPKSKASSSSCSRAAASSSWSETGRPLSAAGRGSSPRSFRR